MATKTSVDRRVSRRALERDVGLLRSAVIGLIGRDPEGEYRPKFVRRIFESLQEKPDYTFTSPEQFLADIRKL